MKMTYSIEPSVEHRGYLDVRTQMEDDGKPLLDVTIAVLPSMLESQFPCVTQTLKRWWARVNGKPMPKDDQFKTLGEINGR